MAEDDSSRVSTSQSMPSTDSSITKQRKKRKWDQPAESLISTGVAAPGVLPLASMGSLVGITVPGVAPVSSASLMNPLGASFGHLQHVLLPSIQQHAAALVQKIQPKIQEELIAREIVINDAEPSIRYKLTKRQTQEEIQKCTGAIVITRGKYRPPNTPSDGEKPLYLHISAGAHLETTADRIKAVDQAAAIVEEILKQGPASNGVKVGQPLSTCVFLGFEPDPSLNITARIRGPNDQYVNHITNETGATVLLSGRGCGISETANSEEQQPLHLFLSSSNPKSLERAKLLAENLLDTVCAECGASRISSCKVYGAVPPPQQLLAGVQSSLNELRSDTTTTAYSTSLSGGSIPTPATTSVISHGTTSDLSQGTAAMFVGGLNSGKSQPNMVCHPQPSLIHGTSYNGYGGIYPQATPLQQVALALRQSTSPITSTVSPTINIGSTTSTTSTSSEKEKRTPHKRKFQELPAAAEVLVKTHQESGVFESNVSSKSWTRTISSMPAPRKLVQQPPKGMPPAPARTMPPPPPPRTMPPPPPKFNSSPSAGKVHPTSIVKKSDSKVVPDTLISLMEYGDEDEDDDSEETIEEPVTSHSKVPAAPKPFWSI